MENMKKYIFVKDNSEVIYGPINYSAAKINEHLEKADQAIRSLSSPEELVKRVEEMNGTNEMLCYDSVVYFLAYAHIKDIKDITIFFGKEDPNKIKPFLKDGKYISHAKVELNGKTYETHWNEKRQGFIEVDHLKLNDSDYSENYEAYRTKILSYKYI